MLRRSQFLLVCLATLLGVASCGRDVTGPRGVRAGAVQLNPAFPMVRLEGQGQPLSVASIVSFTRVRIILLRANGDTVINRVVEFPPESASLSLAFPVTLEPSAPASGEVLSASLRFVSAAGDTVFRGGPVNVVAAPTTSSPPPPPEIPLTYTGPGANAASVAISPKTRTARTGDAIPFSATVRDAQGLTLANTPVAFASLDTSKVRVGLTTGAAVVQGFRGIAMLVAQTVTGQRDTAVVSITPTPTAIAVTAGNNQQVVQRLTFPAPVRVRVTAGDGLPVAGEIVAFTVTAGQGTVSAARDTTDATGFAEVTWTAGALTGSAALRAEVLGTPTTVAVTAVGTQLAPPPATVTLLQGSGQTTAPGTAFADSVRVEVRDQFGDVVPGATVQFTAAGGGSSSPPSVTTGATGLAATRWTAGATGAQQLTVTVGTVPSLVVTGTIATQITRASGGFETARYFQPFPSPVVFRVANDSGRALAGLPVTFTVASGNGTLSAPRDTSDVNGLVSVVWTAGNTSGTALLTATIAGTTLSATASGTQVDPAPTALRFAQQPTAVVAGDTLPTLRIALLDSGGDTARAYTGPIRMSIASGPSGATLTGNLVVAASNGVARFSGLRLPLAGSGYRLTARADSIAGLVSPASDTFSVSPGPVATLRLTGRTAQVAGDTQTVRITALDALGNKATGLQGPLSLSVTACQGAATGEVLTAQSPVSWNATTLVVFSAGVTDIVVRPFTAGAYDLCASLLPGSVVSVAGQRLALQVAPAAPTHFRLAAPATWTAGVPQTVTLTAYDDFENVATGFTSLIQSVLFSGPSASPTGTVPTMTYAGGTPVPFSNNASLAFTNGVATSTLTLFAAEGTTLSAQSGAIGTRTLDVVSVNVLAGPTLALALETVPAGAYTGTTFLSQPVITAVDAYGNSTGQGGLPVTATIASGPGTLGGMVTVPTSTGTGRASFTDLGITGAGSHTLRFSTTAGITAVTSAPFSVATVGTGIRLHVGASDRASAKVNTDLAIPLLIDLSNRGGEDLASLTAYVAWDTTAFSYVGTTAGTWVDDASGSASIFLNTNNVAAGELVISGFTANATTTSFVLRTLTLRPRAAGTTTVHVASGASGNAGGGTISVTVRPLAVTILP